MEKNLTRQAIVIGNYDNIPTSISSDTLIIVMINSLKTNRETDKLFGTNEILTYTITVALKLIVQQ